MKTYEPKPGVTLLEICGEHLLVATGDARGTCPDIIQLNDAGALYWRVITEERSFDRMAERIVREAPDAKPDPRLLLMMYVDKLKKSGYLLEAEE